MTTTLGSTLQDETDFSGPLLELLRTLKSSGYVFVTPTPATHARVTKRYQEARTLRDVLGWILPFRQQTVDQRVFALLEKADALERDNSGLWKAVFRVSSLGEDLFFHSAYPTTDEDAVFFGPDSYRFAEVIKQELERGPAPTRVADIGTGAGVGAIVAAKLCPDAEMVASDVNPLALRLAQINAQAASVSVVPALGEGLAGTVGSFDLICANPPYIVDNAGRDYRDGRGMHGGQVSLEMTREAIERLTIGGKFILYTGCAIVEGVDELRIALEALAEERGCALRYRELDPDVFGEELDKNAYQDVERIAVVAAVIVKQRIP